MKTTLTALMLAVLTLQLVASRLSAQAPGPFEEGFVRMPDGVELYFRAVGSGPDVVLVPGRLFLFDAFAALAPGRRLIFYDMRGRGRSDSVADSATLTVQQDVADLESIRRHFGASAVSLIGYSYLGLVVALHASEHGDVVRRVVQIGPVGPRPAASHARELTANDTVSPFDPAALAEAALLRERGWDRANPREYCEVAWSINRFALVGDPAKVDRLGTGFCTMPNEWPINLDRHFRHNFASVQRLVVSDEQIARVRVPVLTIHGRRDRNAPYGGGREWAARLSDARLLTIPGAAHHAWVESDAVLPAIDRFLSGQWPDAAEVVQ